MNVETRVISLMTRMFQAKAGAITLASVKDSVAGWDSLGHMSLCVALEEEFAVSFTDRHVTGMNSVNNVVRVVETLMRS